MQVIGYVHSLDRGFRDMWGIMKKKNPEFVFGMHRRVENLKESLKQPAMSIAVVILYLTDKTKLPELLPLQSVLIDLPLVILLDDQDPEVLYFSHHLRPRVILYSHFGMKEICLVLKRFLTRYQRQPAACSGSHETPGNIIQQGV